MKFTFSPSATDATLLVAQTDISDYHICQANGLVSWWSEFCDGVNYVASKEEAVTAASTAHLLLSISMTQSAPISVWPYEDAPAAFRTIAGEPGPNVWIAVVKASLVSRGIPEFLSTHAFGRKKTNIITLLNKDVLLIARPS